MWVFLKHLRHAWIHSPYVVSIEDLAEKDDE